MYCSENILDYLVISKLQLHLLITIRPPPFLSFLCLSKVKSNDLGVP